MTESSLLFYCYMVAARGDRPTPTRKKDYIKPETVSGYFEKLVLLKGKN